MTAKGSPCPINGCTAHAKPGQLMCWPHWRRVPKSLNHAVFDTYRSMSATHSPLGPIPPEEKLRRIKAYRQARDAAIDAVNEKETPQG